MVGLQRVVVFNLAGDEGRRKTKALSRTKTNKWKVLHFFGTFITGSFFLIDHNEYFMYFIS